MSADLPSPLQHRLREDMKDSLRAGDKHRLSTLRMALAGIQRRELDSRASLDDAGVEKVLRQLIKQRRDAAAQFSQADREDLAAKENAEIAVLDAYLPDLMTEVEAAALMDRVIDELAASSLKDMGRVMGEIKRRSAGRADLGKLSVLARSRLRQA